MIMEGLVEITGEEFPPHTYFLNPEGKLFAYIRVNDGKLIEFKKPLAFYKSRRKFKKVTHGTFTENYSENFRKKEKEKV